MDFQTITQIFTGGLITEDEAIDRLAEIGIHGAFTVDPEPFGFIGYDYVNQFWIEI